MQKPKITVLIPVYNAERFLAAALDSVLQQSFTDFELLVIDDGSRDQSIAIVQHYQQQDARVRLVLNEHNIGISATLNRGIALAKSGLIARMDADDICYPERLQKQYNYMQTQPECAMVASWVRVITEDGQFVRQDNFRSEFYYYNLTFECWLYHPTILFKKEAVEAIGGYTVPYSEDFELFWQLSREFKIHTLPEVLLDYRVTEQSLHQVLKKQEYHQAQQEQVLRNLRYYMGEDYNLPEAQLECLRHNFLPLLEQGSVSEIHKCLQELAAITKQMLKQENPNRQTAVIEQAARYKRNFILSYFWGRLPVYKRLQLVMATDSWFLVTKAIKNRLKKIV